MNLREWLKGIQLKLKKNRKLIEKPKPETCLFRDWILEEKSLRYKIGSLRKKDCCIDLKAINNLDYSELINEKWGLDKIASYYCEKWKEEVIRKLTVKEFKKYPHVMKYISNHRWDKDRDKNHIYIENTDIIIYITPEDYYSYDEIIIVKKRENLHIEIYSEKLNILIRDIVDEEHTDFIMKALEKLVCVYDEKIRKEDIKNWNE